MMRSTIKILFCLVSLSFIACGGNKKTGNEDEIASRDSRTDFAMERSSQDTLAVVELTKNFLEALKDRNVDAAIDQLYEVKGTEIHPLSVDSREELRKTYSSVPVIDYKIDELYLYSDSDSEVRYSIVMFEKTEDNPMSNITKAALHPFRVNGKWHLTIAPRKVEATPQND